MVINRNNVHIAGNGKQPILFAHGFGCDQNMWRFVAPAFEQDYKVVTFDYVGSGGSDLHAYNKERYQNLNGYADDILDIIKELNLQQVILVGHSVSSMIGLLATIKHPGLFDKLICVSPSPRYINDAEYTGGFEQKDIEELLETMETNYIGWANFLAPAVMQHPEKPELTEELLASFCSTDPVIASLFAKATFFSDNRKDLPKIKIPSLIIQCTDDIIAPQEVGKYMHRQMPKSTLEIINATGHCPHMSDPELTTAIIKRYLNSFFN